MIKVILLALSLLLVDVGPVSAGISDLPSPLRALTYHQDDNFVSVEADMQVIKKVFNTVILSSYDIRNQRWGNYQKIIDAGLTPVMYADFTKFFFRGDLAEVTKRVDNLLAGVAAAPFPLEFVKVADEINYGRAEKEELLTISAIELYLNLTARRFKEAGLTTLVDMKSPELEGRTSDREPYTIVGMQAILATGYIDGVLVGNPGHRRGDANVIAQWTKIRELWPNIPFFSRTSSFSFSEPTFAESGKDIGDLIRWAITIPNSFGSRGFHLWRWNGAYKGGRIHILNEDGSSNALWEDLMELVSGTPAPTPTPDPVATLQG